MINLPPKETLQDWKMVFEMFQSFGLGLGALLGGLGGFIVFFDWLEKKRRQAEINQLKKFYNRKDFFRKSIILVNEPNTPGWIFLLDDRTKTRHWIKNPQTMKDLGYSYSDVVNVSKGKFSRYKESNEISTA